MGLRFLLNFVAQPEGLPESSRWSESAETTGKVARHDRTQKGCQTSQVQTGNIVYRINRAHGLHSGGKEKVPMPWKETREGKRRGEA